MSDNSLTDCREIKFVYVLSELQLRLVLCVFYVIIKKTLKIMKIFPLREKCTEISFNEL